MEYKLKLINPSSSRLEHLITQMKWRLKEGQGEAIYKIGVEDNGVCAGLTDDELEATVNTLETMAERYCKLSLDLVQLKNKSLLCNHDRVLKNNNCTVFRFVEVLLLFLLGNLVKNSQQMCCASLMTLERIHLMIMYTHTRIKIFATCLLSSLLSFSM